MLRKKVVFCICALLCAAILFSGCGAPAVTPFKYVYSKEENTQLLFRSSDANLDDFLNDYYHRHARFDSYAINAMQLGTGGAAWKEWEALSLLWLDSTQQNYRSDSFKLIRDWLNTAVIDEYGYTWSAEPNDSLTGVDWQQTFGQGWPFPNSEYSFEFNTDSNKEGWAAGISGGSKTQDAVTGGAYRLNVADTDSFYFAYKPSSSGSYLNTRYSPYLEFDFRYELADAPAIDDIYIGWKTSQGQSYEIKAAGYAARNKEFGKSFQSHFYIPMYMHSGWGVDKSIKEVRIEVRAEGGAKLSGSYLLNFVRGSYDTRQIDNNTNYLTVSKMYYDYTGDAAVLEANLERVRSSMMFLLYGLGGESGLVDLSNFIGHDGGTAGDKGRSNPSSYWDILSTSPKSLYAQSKFYSALKAYIGLEEAADALSITGDAPTVRLADGGTKTFDLSLPAARSLKTTVENKVRQNVNASAREGYFDAVKGRFIDGFDLYGDVIDYGSVIFNLMAVSEGLASEQQAQSIMSWISGEREVAGDNARGKTGASLYGTNCGIYDFVFAPRATTVKNSRHYEWGWSPNTNKVYGTYIQDGGTMAFISYYDLISRLKYKGADNAFARLSEISDWYLDIFDYAVDNNVQPEQFYREYYTANSGVGLQGMGVAGVLGLDSEFIENSILYASVPLGFFGLDVSKANTVSLSPALPSALKFWKLENLMYRGVRYDAVIGKDFAMLKSVRGDAGGYGFEVNFKYGGASPQVTVNGEPAAAGSYTLKDGVLTVRTEFSECEILVS